MLFCMSCSFLKRTIAKVKTYSFVTKQKEREMLFPRSFLVVIIKDIILLVVPTQEFWLVGRTLPMVQSIG